MPAVRQGVRGKSFCCKVNRAPLKVSAIVWKTRNRINKFVDSKVIKEQIKKTWTAIKSVSFVLAILKKKA
jgi:hypothetical protein